MGERGRLARNNHLVPRRSDNIDLEEDGAAGVLSFYYIMMLQILYTTTYYPCLHLLKAN